MPNASARNAGGRKRSVVAKMRFVPSEEMDRRSSFEKPAECPAMCLSTATHARSRADVTDRRASHIAAAGPSPAIADAAQLVCEVLRTVSHFHANGMVIRDVKADLCADVTGLFAAEALCLRG